MMPLVRPIFREHFALHPIPGQGYVLLSETESFALEGPYLACVAPLIDGQRTSAEIAGLLSGQLTPEQTFWTIDFLRRSGHLREADGTAAGTAAFWCGLGVDPGQARAAFAAKPVEVRTSGGAGAADLVRWLATLGARFAQPGAIGLVVARDYLDPELDALNAEYMARALPWFLVKSSGLTPWIGPLFLPGHTGCWACLAQRLRENRAVETFVGEQLGLRGMPYAPEPDAPLSQAFGGAFAAAQVARLIVSGTSPVLEGAVVTIDPYAAETRRHLLTKRPQCPACGRSAPAVGGARPNFAARIAAGRTENGERARTAAETFAMYQHHVSPITGVTKSLMPSPHNTGTPLRSYVAGQNLALRSRGLGNLKGNLRSFSSGKGRTEEQAMTSALCEALERYSGKFRGEEIRFPATFRDLRDAAIHPNDIMLYSERQYAGRDGWNARGAPFQVVPLPFDREAKVDWTPVWSYTENRVKYVATAQLFYGYPSPPADFFTWPDSNGAAAGASYEDACLQGLCELVERDGVALWWYNRATRPALDIDDIDDPLLREYKAFYDRIDREFWVLDLTSDLGVPTFAAVNRRRHGPTEDIILGFGAHPDPAIAAMRAITEMNQFMPAVLAVGEDGRTEYGFDDPDALRWWREATLANQPYLKPAAGMRRLSDFPGSGPARIDETLDGLIGTIERAGCEVLILEQTRADIGLPVVKMLAPGLRHFWARFAPGRLYRVPAELGWIDTPMVEDALNPIAMFL